MRRTPLYLAAWVAAGLGAVALTSVAVGQVGNQVTGSRPAPFSEAEVQAALEAETSTTATTVADTPSSTPTTAAPSTTTTAAPVTTTTAPSAPTTTAAPTETRTFTLVGGTATLRFGPGGVTVVTATPNSGFSVQVEPADDHSGGVEVEFRSEAHRSKVEGWWDGGPRSETSEEAED